MVADATREVFLAVCIGPLTCGAIGGALARWIILEDDPASLLWAVTLLVLTVFGACGPVLYAAQHFSKDLALFAVRRYEGALHGALAVVGALSMMLAAYTTATGPSIWSWTLVASPVLIGVVGSLALARAEPRRSVKFTDADDHTLLRRARRAGLVVGVVVGALLGARAAGWFGAYAGAYCGASIGLAGGRGVAELVTVPREQWARRGDAVGSIAFGVGAAAGAIVGGLGVAAFFGAADWVAILVGFMVGGFLVGGGTALLAGGAGRWPAIRAVVPTVGVLAGLTVALGIGAALGSQVVAVAVAPVTAAFGCAWALFGIADI